MNKLFISLALASVAIIPAWAQQYHPQFWDNSSVGSYADNMSSADIQTEALLLKLQLILDSDRMPETMYLQHLYRIYEIEQTATIDYVTASGEPLPWKEEDEHAATLFGAEVEDNSINEKKSEETGATVYTLKFKSPVTSISGELFSEDVMSLRLPGQADVSYIPSKATNVQRLKRLTGGGTHNGMLISTNGTLITAATADTTSCHIPKEVHHIGVCAFSHSGIEELIIPEGVQTIGEEAFVGTQMKRLYIMASTPPSISTQDLMTLSETIIYVPKKQLKIYKKAWPSVKKKLKALPKGF